MSAARLRAMAEKATGSPWRSVFYGFNIGTKRRMSVLVKGPNDGDDCADYLALVASNCTPDDAAMIVHLRNRATLYADLIEAATEWSDAVQAESEADSDAMNGEDVDAVGAMDRRHNAEFRLNLALAAIDAADKEGV